MKTSESPNVLVGLIRPRFLVLVGLPAWGAPGSRIPHNWLYLAIVDVFTREMPGAGIRYLTARPADRARIRCPDSYRVAGPRVRLR
jgi:hypothetical protein